MKFKHRAVYYNLKYIIQWGGGCNVAPFNQNVTFKHRGFKFLWAIVLFPSCKRTEGTPSNVIGNRLWKNLIALVWTAFRVFQKSLDYNLNIIFKNIYKHFSNCYCCSYLVSELSYLLRDCLLCVNKTNVVIQLKMNLRQERTVLIL